MNLMDLRSDIINWSDKRFVRLDIMGGQPEVIEQIFEEALALEPTERAAFLHEACKNDLQLRAAVEELLALDARAGSFLEHPPIDLLDAPIGTVKEPASTASNAEAFVFPTMAPCRFQPGQVLIDRFVIVRFIAQGGMGEVYEVEDTFLQGVHLALKTILPQIADDPDLQQRFEREVLVAREVTHPNLCPIYDIFRAEQPPPKFLFLTMKFLPGETLSKRLRGAAPITIEEGMAIMKQMAAGLAAIHDAGIVHRDIKPNNIMLEGVGADVRLCITDFGLARAYEGEPSLSGKGVIVGTPGYLAPELYQGELPSRASDLFAFGVVLHMIFTGQKPASASDTGPVAMSPRMQSAGVPSFCIELIRQCLDRDPQRRCQAFDQALELLRVRYRPAESWSRRRFIGAAMATGTALVGAAWWKRDDLENFLHPLPAKRFVALLSWPKPSDVHMTPMLTSVLSAIKTTLARAEAYDRELFVISPDEVNVDVAQLTKLQDVCNPLGANLVLAASALPVGEGFQLLLRLLNPMSGQPLREKKLSCTLSEVTTLPDRAVQAAASLLGLTSYLRKSALPKPETQSVEAFTAFQSAEALMEQPNDQGLDEAIEKYKDAINLDPRYAIAYAKLSQAYVHFGVVHRNSAALYLARGNGETALSLDPRLVEGYLAMAIVFEYSGKEQAALDAFAKALALDPSNPTTLVWQAQLYTRLNRWPDAEKAFRRVLKERPNYWLTYNELGFGLEGQGRYQEAVEAFRAASLAAPKNSLTLSNLGDEYLQIGDIAEATESLKKALELDPKSDAAAGYTSLALRYQGKFEEALPFALLAVQFNPGLDANWLELADCYASLHNHQTEAKDAFLRAQTEAERHLLTDGTDGPSWMLLALYRTKSGNPQGVPALIEKAEKLGARDITSQLYKARIWELIGNREQALATLNACFKRGATELQLVPFPDLEGLRRDPRYRQLVASNPVAITKAG